MVEGAPRQATVINAERTALKEWAVLVDAMGRGDIIAMVRKGGIREQRAGFTVRHDRFLLYPTFFHEKEGELAARFRPMLHASHAARPREGMIRIRYVADALAVWGVSELQRLPGIALEHGLDWTAVESRFHYRNRPGVRVVAVRVSRLAREAELPEVRRYAGCVSWVELDSDVDVAGSTPVLDAATLERRVAAITSVLGDPLDSRA
jgi:hypothetical protein